MTRPSGPPGSGAALGRTLRTARYLRARQVLDRVARRFARGVAPGASDVRARVPSGPWVPPPATVRHFTPPDVFRFQGIAREIASPAAWRMAGVPHLWLYHLHYFDDLALAPGGSDEASLRRLVERWIAENPVGSAPGWDPYPASLRIVNWLKWTLAGRSLPAGADRSLALQSCWLEKRLEHHLGANHLFENGKALWFAGGCFEGAAADRWSRTGRDLTLRELDEQVLADGGHFERSPMYHSRMLENVLDLLNLERASGRCVPAALAPTAERMLVWLAAMTHPDGNYALLNDAAQEQAAPLRRLAGYAAALGVRVPATSPSSVHLVASGFARLSVGPWVLLTDVGGPGPDHQPAHAHAGTLTFEASLDGEQLIVDAGTSTYEEGPQREWERSTAAHNTVVLDGRDSSEVWKAFRVGARARVVASEFSSGPGAVRLNAAHDGYGRTHGVLHAREWRVAAGEIAITDELRGRGAPRVDWHLRLHPGVNVEPAGGTAFELRRRGRPVAAFVGDRALEWSVEPADYHPRFGVTEAAAEIRGSATLALPATLRSTLRSL